MVEETGTVIEVSKSAAKVLIPNSEACAGCGSCHESTGGFTMICDVPRIDGLTLGDKVRLAGREASQTKGGLLLFILPLAFLFIGYLVGEATVTALRYQALAEVVGVATGFLFFAILFLIVYLVYQQRKRSGHFVLRIVEIEKKGDFES
jgi:positive regulator of sigma E activity